MNRGWSNIFAYYSGAESRGNCQNRFFPSIKASIGCVASSAIPFNRSVTDEGFKMNARSAARFALVVALGVFGSAMELGASVVTVNITVVDESGKPVRDAEVNIPFQDDRPLVWGSLGKPAIGKTDENGRYSASGRIGASYGASARHPGYYLGWSGSTPYDATKPPKQLEAQIVLRPILNPIPLFARRVETHVPGVDEDYLFDLMALDWVGPHGKGTVGDMKVRVRDDLTLGMTMTATSRGRSSAARTESNEFRLRRWREVY